MSKQVINLYSNEFLPKQEFILVKPEELQTERTTDGGIIISMKTGSEVNDRPSSGKVISVGENVEEIDIDEFVIWPGTDGLDLSFIDGDFLLLRSKSIIGIKVKVED